MASKRDLKKAIRRSCGEMAEECFIASFLTPGEAEDWDGVIIDIALLQTKALKKAAMRCNVKPKEFENPRLYRKARKEFYAEAEKEVAELIKNEAAGIAKTMNELDKRD